MLIILCADDAGMAAPGKESINDPVKELCDEGFNLEMEDDFMEHLGIGMEHRDDGTICVTQKGLIEKIIETTKTTGCKPNSAPAQQVASGSDPDRELWDQSTRNCAKVWLGCCCTCFKQHSSS